MVHDYVTKVRVDPEVKETYMKFEEIIEYNRKEGHEAGLEEGTLIAKRQAVINILCLHGDIPNNLKTIIENENSIKKLDDWLLIAAKSNKFDAFLENISINLANC